MNSKVHNTFTLLMITGALVLGLFGASSTMLPVAGRVFAPGDALTAVPMINETAHATPTADAAAVAGLATTFQDTAAPATVKKSGHKSGKSRRIRQSMAMPFFSFLPRG